MKTGETFREYFDRRQKKYDAKEEKGYAKIEKASATEKKEILDFLTTELDKKLGHYIKKLDFSSNTRPHLHLGHGPIMKNLSATDREEINQILSRQYEFNIEFWYYDVPPSVPILEQQILDSQWYSIILH